MDWRACFHKLTAVKQEHEKKLSEKRREVEAKIRKVEPIIVRVCKRFAKGMRWKYKAKHRSCCGPSYSLKWKEGGILGRVLELEGEWTGYTICVDIPHYYPENDDVGDPWGIKIEISYLYGRAIASRSISFDEFTEEKLINAIEDCYKERFEGR